MDFLQETTFTVFIALVLTFLVAKILSFFAVSDSTSDVSTAGSSVDEGAVAKEVTEERELKVRSRKGEKRVKFVDDVVIRRIDHFEGSENLVIVDDEKESGVRVDQFVDDGLGEDFGVKNSEKECPDLGEMNDTNALVEGCEKSENLIEEEVGFVNENVGNLGEGELVSDDVANDERDENVDDDDWEGIERSELEKVFAEAVNYVEYGGKDKGDDRLSKLGSDAQMQLYGLHKVAVEGPCCEPQPMALMVSARGKWNSWQRLGSMSQEVAMEQYIRVLSENIPDWMHEFSADDGIQRKMGMKDEISGAEQERKSELNTTPIGDSSTSEGSVDKVDGV